MNCTILTKKDNSLLKREEITVKIENEKCPKKEEVLSSLNLNQELSVVKKISSSFGKKEFEAEIFVYKTKEDKDKIEKIPRKVRKKMLEELKKQQENKTA